jgi:hypothetical protein
MITSSPHVTRSVFEEHTGWVLKPEGACKGDVCIPLPDIDGDEVDIRRLAAAMRLPLIHDETHGVWVLGSEAIGSRTLMTADAPELALPDRYGNEFRLASLSGEKVVLLAWAPY